MDTNYAHLAEAYDELFPLDPEALAFVTSTLGNPSGPHVVDAGCGTGSLAQALAEQGVHVFGFDLDDALLQKALGRQGQNPRLLFERGDLTQWTLPAGWPRVDAVVSLGNTLPHLTTESQLCSFLERSAKNLCPQGSLVVQVLDYDSLERNSILELPRRCVGTWTFERRYEVRPDGLWTFHTQIEGLHGRQSQSFSLRPWKRHELERILTSSGFTVMGTYGGFDRSAPGSSLPLVLEARTA